MALVHIINFIHKLETAQRNNNLNANTIYRSYLFFISTEKAAEWKTNSSSKSDGHIAVFSRVDDLQLVVVIASCQRMSGLSETDIDDALTTTHILQQLNHMHNVVTTFENKLRINCLQQNKKKYNDTNAAR